MICFHTTVYIPMVWWLLSAGLRSISQFKLNRFNWLVKSGWLYPHSKLNWLVGYGWLYMYISHHIPIRFHYIPRCLHKVSIIINNMYCLPNEIKSHSLLYPHITWICLRTPHQQTNYIVLPIDSPSIGFNIGKTKIISKSKVQ
jgi:hypothetical protein